MYGDRPQESQQFTGERRDDLIVVLATSRQREEPFMQSLLRFPGDPPGFFAEPQRLLPAQQPAHDAGPMSVGPSRLHQHPAQVNIAGLGDPAALNSVSTEMFRDTRPL